MMITCLKRLLAHTALSFAVVCLASLGFAAVASADLGDSKSRIEQNYGEAVLVQDATKRIWTPSEWQVLSQGRAKAYGYRVTNTGLQGMVWVEYQQDKVVKETTIMDAGIRIRDFKEYFGSLYSQLTAPDSAVFFIKAFPKDQLGVIVRKSADYYQLIRFSMENAGDTTRVNMHSRVKSFEVSPLAAAEAQNYLQQNRVTRTAIDGSGQLAAAAGTWLRTDNFFRPEIFFSEDLLPRVKTDMIVIHHTDLDNMPVADIHELHLTKGWAGIGYHKVIFADGSIAIGRPENTIGAHALGANPRSIGIVLVGDFDKKPPTSVQLEAAVKLTGQLMRKYSIPIENVLPHRAVTPGTSCPGDAFPWDEFIRRLKEQMV